MPQRAGGCAGVSKPHGENVKCLASAALCGFRLSALTQEAAEESGRGFIHPLSPGCVVRFYNTQSATGTVSYSRYGQVIESRRSPNTQRPRAPPRSIRTPSIPSPTRHRFLETRPGASTRRPLLPARSSLSPRTRQRLCRRGESSPFEERWSKRLVGCSLREDSPPRSRKPAAQTRKRSCRGTNRVCFLFCFVFCGGGVFPPR